MTNEELQRIGSTKRLKPGDRVKVPGVGLCVIALHPQDEALH